MSAINALAVDARAVTVGGDVFTYFVHLFKIRDGGMDENSSLFIQYSKWRHGNPVDCISPQEHRIVFSNWFNVTILNSLMQLYLATKNVTSPSSNIGGAKSL